jgi:nitrile hydratase accessory protein
MADSFEINEEAPVFAAPWQAQAFAMTMQLSQNGAFTWGDWVKVFSTEIRADPAQPGEDSLSAYYRQWLTALQTILTSTGLSTPEEIAGMETLWRAAYAKTPHGLPIALENASLDFGPDHDGGHDHDDHAHHHHHVIGRREPVAISPALEKTPRG